MDRIFQRDKSLKCLNTFGIEVLAKFYVEVNSEADLFEVFKQPVINDYPILILGGGSNILFTKDFEGIILHMKIGGIAANSIDDYIYVTAGGGIIWNDLVQYCVNNEYSGIENLSLIPGTVGASPVQNIGAYGVELMDVFSSCRAFDRHEQKMVEFNKEDCRFSYRDSFFKNEGKGRYIITSVTLKLAKEPKLNLTYGAVKDELERRRISTPTLKDVSTVVSEIRVSKLPDPATIGNSGSFFKNPVISKTQLSQLQSTFPDIVYYPIHLDQVKIAAGWLIEKCGWKGIKIGETGTWKNQALVLVNYGNASGSDVYDLSEAIIESVNATFGIKLEREVNII